MLIGNAGVIVTEKRISMLVKIPDWLSSTKRINSKNCSKLYKEALSKKLGIKIISLGQLKKEVQKAGIKSAEKYRLKRKPHWPSAPNRNYKDKWISWYDLFGKKDKKIDISLGQLKKEVQKLTIKNQEEYYLKRKPRWPSVPEQYYKDEWINWCDFLGK